MKYTYFYKTSDGKRHEACIEGKCREDVFIELRKQGIKAIKVVAADGSKANGEVRGVRKRVAALIAVVVAVIVGGVFFFVGERSSTTNYHLPSTNSTPRHQIYGDPVIVGRYERGDFGSVLTNRADQMLAWFAQPGRLMCPKGLNPRRMAAEFANALGNRSDDSGLIGLCEDEPREVLELKQIVNGMHLELAEYLANGNGTPRSFWRRLIERTTQESQIFELARRELANESSEYVWEERNAALRRLGLRTLTQDTTEE